MFSWRGASTAPIDSGPCVHMSECGVTRHKRSLEEQQSRGEEAGCLTIRDNKGQL